MAFVKARRGCELAWIGVSFDIHLEDLYLEIPEEKRNELLELILEASKLNVVPLKAVRRIAGIASHFASVIYVWRPFLNDLYGAMPFPSKESISAAPTNCIWLKQIRPSLCWMRAFFATSSRFAPPSFPSFSFRQQGGFHTYLGRCVRLGPWRCVDHRGDLRRVVRCPAYRDV